jgi:hypothetical protein
MLVSDGEAGEAVIRRYTDLPPADCAFMALEVASTLTPAQRATLLGVRRVESPRLRRVNVRSLIVLRRLGLISRRADDGTYALSPLGVVVLAVLPYASGLRPRVR